jgi:hypothetical protein
LASLVVSADTCDKRNGLLSRSRKKGIFSATINPVSLGPTRLQTAPQSLRNTVPETQNASTPNSVSNAAQLLLSAQALRTGPPAPAAAPSGRISLPEGQPEAQNLVVQTRSSLLVNAGGALLAQANSLPSGVLSLLRD